MTLDERILKLRIGIEKETNKDIKKVLLEQKKALEQLRKEVGNIYMRYSDENDELNMSYSDRYNEMKKVEKSLANMKTVLGSAIIAITGKSLMKSYVDSYYKTANILSDNIIIDKENTSNNVDIGINFQLLRPEFIESVVHANFEGQTFSNRIWKHQDQLIAQLIAQLYDTISNGMTEGKSIQKMSKEIKDRFGASSYNSTRLIRNESARITSNAQDQIYKDSGVVQEIMFNATLDNRTTEICQGLDGNRYKLTDNYPRIPKDTHIQCRSCYVPIIDGNLPKVRRDNITKEVIPYKNYSEWAKDNNID